MQGDIFMLDQTSTQAAAQTTPASRASSKVQAVAAQVAIYNEDDLSHLLYSSVESVHHAHHHHHHHHHQHHEHFDGSLTPLTAPASSGTHTPLFSEHGGADYCASDNESAVLEGDDDYDDIHRGGALLDDELDFEIPPSPVPRRRGGTMCSSDDDFEWPVFLGRQADELAPSLRRRSSASSAAPPEPAIKRPAPAPAAAGEIPHGNHVERIEGPLMALWPAAAVDVLEWSERFYE